MLTLTLLEKIAVWALPVLFAITVHEVAHGWIARARGDATAARLGRLTLNPVRHVDPVGTLLVPGAMLTLSSMFAGHGFLFGWAKPVPVDWRQLRDPRRDMALVAAAGPFANLLMLVGWALVARFAWTWYDHLPATVGTVLVLSGVAGIFINVILMVINLVPLPPLDGGRVAVGLLPLPAARALSRLEPWGLVIIVVLLVSGWLGTLVGPVLEPVLRAAAHLSGLSWLQFNSVLAGLT